MKGGQTGEAKHALLNGAHVFETEMSRTWGGDAAWLTTGRKVAELVAGVLREMADELPERVGAVPTPRVCSQCGERDSAMVKIGTTDGWCTACLDEAAEPADPVPAAEAVADLEPGQRHVPPVEGGGYDFLLNRCCDLDQAAHAAHLDEGVYDPSCCWCEDKYGRPS